MAKGLRTFIISAILGSLFIIALINGAIILAEVNQANQSITDYEPLAIYSANLNDSVSGSLDVSTSAQTALGESPTTLSLSGVVFDTIGSLWKSLIGIPVTIFKLTSDFIFVNIFGGATFSIVFNSILAMITLTIIFFVVKWAVSGDGG